MVETASVVIEACMRHLGVGLESKSKPLKWMAEGRNKWL
jgi:hypothetical protein